MNARKKARKFGCSPLWKNEAIDNKVEKKWVRNDSAGPPVNEDFTKNPISYCVFQYEESPNHWSCRVVGQLTLEEVILRVLVWVVGGADNVEGAPACQHLVEEHTQRPPV